MQTSVATFEAEKLVESIKGYGLAEVMLSHETCSVRLAGYLHNHTVSFANALPGRQISQKQPAKRQHAEGREISEHAGRKCSVAAPA